MPLTRYCPLLLYMYIVELLSKMQMLVMDEVMTQQRPDPNAAGSTIGPEIKIDMQNLNSQISSQYQGHGETSTETAIHQQADISVDGVNFEEGSSPPSQNETQAEDLKTVLRVAILVTQIAAGGVIAVLAGFIGNQTSSSTHKLFFNASIISICAAFVFGVCILILKIFFTNISCLMVIVKILIPAVIGSVAMVVGFGVTVCFRRN